MSELRLWLYPSNWLYNAGVIGFLRVLEEVGKEDVKSLVEKRPLEIKKSLFLRKEKSLPKFIENLMDYYFPKEKLKEWKEKDDKKEKYRKYAREVLEKLGLSETEENLDIGYKYKALHGKLFTSKKPFQNLIQDSEWKSFEFIDLVEKSLNLKEGEGSPMRCFFCGEKRLWYSDPPSGLEVRIQKFQYAHFKGIASSLEKFPNAFWGLNHSLHICPVCVSILLHYPLAFTPTSDGEIFINAPDFRLMWYLNKFAREVVGREGGKDVRKIFGLSLMQWAIRISQTLGAWTMANVEVIRKWRKEKEEFIDHFELPYDVVRVLMDPTAASLLQGIGSWPILELVMRGRFSELLLAAYCAARALLLNKSENHCIEKYRGDENTPGEMFSRLPLLFSRIKEIVKEGNMSNYSDARGLKEAGQRLKLKGEFERSVFRILELTRLGKINDAYQAILRILVANKKPVPGELVKILQVEDIEIKKSYIYAFLSGVLGKEEGGE